MQFDIIGVGAYVLYGNYMNFRLFFLHLLMGITLIGLSGCAKYKAQSLHALITSPKVDKSLSFEYKIFTVDDCKKYLGRNVIAKGYQPIHITFVNNTNRYITISHKNFSFPCARVQEVAEAVHTNTTARAIGYGVTSLLLWPFIIPAIVDSIGSEKANEKLNVDFAYKVLRNQIVKPNSTVSGIVFAVCDDFDENFTITIIDNQSKKAYVLTPENNTLQI